MKQLYELLFYQQKQTQMTNHSSGVLVDFYC